MVKNNYFFRVVTSILALVAIAAIAMFELTIVAMAIGTVRLFNQRATFRWKKSQKSQTNSAIGQNRPTICSPTTPAGLLFLYHAIHLLLASLYYNKIIKNKDMENNNNVQNKTWHDKHKEGLSFGQKISDGLANGMGSWSFIIIQTIFVILWMILNIIAYVYHWDPYPFILLNLLFSTQAAYAAPIIMMAQNRQSERDRVQATEDYKTNLRAKQEIEELQKSLYRIENQKLDAVIKTLEEIKNKK